MRIMRTMTAAVMAGTFLLAAPLMHAADSKPKTAAKPKPYPLKTCVVTDEKLDKNAYVWVHQGQEIKMCCDGCKDDFLKDPAKFLKKIEAAQKKPAK